LNPNASEEGVDKMNYYEMKFGKERTERMIPYMKQIGASENINFSYGGKVANTLNSHRLIEYAKKKSGLKCQDQVVDSLFKSYFEKEENLGDLSVLVSAAEISGLDKTEAEAFLKSDEGSAEVRNDMKNWRYRYRVDGVPFFILSAEDDAGAEYTLSGAQEPNAFTQVFEQFLRK